MRGTAVSLPSALLPDVADGLLSVKERERETGQRERRQRERTKRE